MYLLVKIEVVWDAFHIYQAVLVPLDRYEELLALNETVNGFLMSTYLFLQNVPAVIIVITGIIKIVIFFKDIIRSKKKTSTEDAL